MHVCLYAVYTYTDTCAHMHTDMHAYTYLEGRCTELLEESPAAAQDQGCEHVFAVQASKALWQVWDWGKKPTYRASLPEKITAMVFSQDPLSLSLVSLIW